MKVNIFSINWPHQTLLCMLSMVWISGLWGQAPVQTLRVDPAQAYGGMVSDYFSEITYIPLESKKQSVFGQVTQLTITDSSFVVVDDDTKAVLFFDLHGKFLNKVVSQNGHIPAEVILNKPDSQVLVLITRPNNPKFQIKSFSYTGSFLAERTLDSALSKRISSAYFDREYSAFGYNLAEISNTQKADSFHFWKIYKNSSLYKSLVGYDMKTNGALAILGTRMPIMVRIPPIHPSGFFYYATPLDHRLYKITKDTAIAVYQFIFPASIQIDKKYLAIRDLKKIDSISMVWNWFKPADVLQVGNIMGNQDNLFFMTQTASDAIFNAKGEVINRNFFYNLHNGRLVSLERITADGLSHFLPIIAPRVINQKGVHYYNNQLYTHVSSLEMFTAKESTESRKISYPPELQSYFKYQNRKSNPVIVKMTLKE